MKNSAPLGEPGSAGLLRNVGGWLRVQLERIRPSFTRRDFRDNFLICKGFELFLWTTLQSYMWHRHPALVLKALELDNNTICANRDLMNLVFELQYAPGFNVALMSFREMCNIFLLVERTSEVAGDIAEVGVYRGASAKITCEAKGDRTLHLFDTFCGLPAPDDSIDVLEQGVMRDTSLPQAMKSLDRYPNLFFHKGLFPDSAAPVGDRRFSFVHLDTDLYVSTRDALQFFCERTTPGAIIVGHDYDSLDTPGVKTTFDEFFCDKPKSLVESWDSQCMMVKHAS